MPILNNRAVARIVKTARRPIQLLAVKPPARVEEHSVVDCVIAAGTATTPYLELRKQRVKTVASLHPVFKRVHIKVADNKSARRCFGSLYVEDRFAEGLLDRLPGLVQELIRLDVEVIAATPTPAAS